MRLDPRERARMVEARMIAREALTCTECGGVMRVGALVLCGDGYTRVYGEYVLSEEDELHEENWPEAHVSCVRELEFLPPE
jgi:hypothetical protein